MPLNDIKNTDIILMFLNDINTVDILLNNIKVFDMRCLYENRLMCLFHH